MDKIDKLIEKIEAEIERNQDSMTKGLREKEHEKIIEIFDTNITYLSIFKEMAIEVKEED